MARLVLDHVGKRFDRLRVIAKVTIKGFGTGWLCKCDCGNEVKVRGANLLAGNTRSCGCIQKRNTHYERTRPRRGDTKLTWELMQNRCLNTSSSQYPDYGGRGITVCERWLNYENFVVDMGERPMGTTLDRYPDNNGNYEPTNCRWATPKQQANNRRDNIRLVAFGREQTLRQWADEYKVPVSTLTGRLKKHDPEKALTLPLYDNLRTPEMKAAFYRNRKSTRFVTAFGQTKSLVEWSEEYGISSGVLGARISKRGMSPEEALTTPMMWRGVRRKGMKFATSTPEKD